MSDIPDHVPPEELELAAKMYHGAINPGCSLHELRQLVALMEIGNQQSSNAYLNAKRWLTEAEAEAKPFTWPPHLDRCRNEATRDVIFTLEARRWQWLGVPEGYHVDDEAEIGALIKDTDDHVRLNAAAVYSLHLTFPTDLGDVPCVLGEWHVESIWLSREEAQAYAQAHEYNYREGWRVYGHCANGALAKLLKYT